MHESRFIWQLQLCLLLIAAIPGCTSGTEPNDTPKPYAVGATVIVYAQSGGNDALIEAELLVDGESISPRQVFTAGTFQALLSATKYLPSKGSHTVAVRIVQQKYVTVDYLISGAAYAVNGKTGDTVRSDFPPTLRTLKAGDRVTVAVSIP